MTQLHLTTWPPLDAEGRSRDDDVNHPHPDNLHGLLYTILGTCLTFLGTNVGTIVGMFAVIFGCWVQWQMLALRRLEIADKIASKTRCGP